VTGTLGSLSANTQPVVQDPTIPASISQPRQEVPKGAVRRPVAPTCPTEPHPRPGAPGGGSRRTNHGTVGRALADTGTTTPAAAMGAVGLVAAGLLALRRRLAEEDVE
jgi:hypothetical protein